MDFSKLSQSNHIALGGATVALVSGVFPWYSAGFVSRGAGALGGLGILCVLGGVVILLMKVLEMQDVEFQGLSAEQLAMIVTAAGVLFMILAVLFTSGWGRSFGMFMGVVSGGAALTGTVLSAKDEGIEIPSVEDITGGGSDSAGPSTF